MGVFSLKSQIVAQEGWNIDLAASNTNLRKSVTKFSKEKKELSTNVVELKSKNEELVDMLIELVKESTVQSS